MSQNNTLRQLPYDHPAVQARYAAQLTANGAGSGSLSGKFVAHAALQVYGVTFQTTTPGTSTYTVAGTATAQATQMSALYISNTATATVAVTTNTVGPFTIGGTTTTGTNVSVGGVGGGLANGYNGPYALNTLGGTNTSQVWGTNTFVTGTATGVQVQSAPFGATPGLGGLPMNPGDSIQFVMGTDTSAVIIPILQYGIQPVSANVIA